MPFTVFGPGVQASMSARQLFPAQGVEDVGEVAPFPRIHGSEEADQGTEGWPLPPRQRTRGQQARAAYGEAEHPSTEPERVETAAEIMSSPVVTLNRDASVADAWELFHRRGFRHLPILDPTGNLVAILSDRDLLRQASALQENPEGGLGDLIVERVLTATPDTSIRDVARVMYEHHIGALPIVTINGDLRGIITREDILRTLIRSASLELWA